ncbi:MAG: glycosyltransferase [Bacteroidota bacterium]|nr:glycosyltransferase [Bacteroidota bacterium]
MDISVVVAVYNKPELLRLILAAYARQSADGFEVIVADDGSGPEVAAVVEDAREAHDLPLQHLWHEDRGWRKNLMLNNAIRAARSGYLVFTDGDCLPHPHFVADHLREREEGRYLCGRRVEMSARWSARLDSALVRSGGFASIGVREWWDGMTGRALRIEDGLRFESRRIRNILHASPRGMLGSNFSVHRAALERINGFDEEYDGPGCGEDSDVQLRLERAGLRCKSLRHLAIQYHVHHPRTTVPRRCLDRFARLQAGKAVRCRRGLINEEPYSDEHSS